MLGLLTIRRRYCSEHLTKILELPHVRIRTLILSFDYHHDTYHTTSALLVTLGLKVILRIGVNTRKRTYK